MQPSDKEINQSIKLLEEEIKRLKEIERIREKTMEQVMSAPDIRWDKIKLIKEAIQNSSYHVPAEEVAKKMLGRMLLDRIR